MAADREGRRELAAIQPFLTAPLRLFRKRSRPQAWAPLQHKSRQMGDEFSLRFLGLGQGGTYTWKRSHGVPPFPGIFLEDLVRSAPGVPEAGAPVGSGEESARVWSALYEGEGNGECGIRSRSGSEPLDPASPPIKPQSGVVKGPDEDSPTTRSPSEHHPPTTRSPSISAQLVPEDLSLNAVIAAWPRLSPEDRQRIVAIVQGRSAP